MRFLLIDDSRDDRTLTRLRLERDFPGSTFREVGRRQELDEALAGADYDLILLDYYLRWSNGLAVLRAIKPKFPHTPVIMLTDSGSEEIAIEGMKAGLSDYVLKGRPERLGVAVAESIEKTRLRREYEAALRTQTELSQRLAEMNRRKDEFLAMLGHELRNPLATIVNALQVIRLSASSPEAAEEARSIADGQARHMARMIDDLLDVSRVIHGAYQLRKEFLAVGDVVARSVEASRPIFSQRRHSLSVDMPADPVVVEADPSRLEQVFTNILTNAAKYTEPGGAVRVTVTHGSDSVTVSVVDDGLGIDAETLPRVFELFTQAPRTLDRSQGGLGIGLTMVKRLVELHGGEVAVHSAGLDRGSEFRVTLPLASRGAAEGPVERRDEDSPGSVRVLVVDDNHGMAQMLAAMLKAWGHEVVVAHDGPGALAAAEASRPEVVLLDIGLPGISGLEVAEKFRERAELGRPLLAALSGYGADDDREKAFASGFDHYLVKPADPSLLRKILDTAARLR